MRRRWWWCWAWLVTGEITETILGPARTSQPAIKIQVLCFGSQSTSIYTTFCYYYRKGRERLHTAHSNSIGLCQPRHMTGFPLLSPLKFQSVRTYFVHTATRKITRDPVAKDSRVGINIFVRRTANPVFHLYLCIEPRTAWVRDLNSWNWFMFINHLFCILGCSKSIELMATRFKTI